MKNFILSVSCIFVACIASAQKTKMPYHFSINGSYVMGSNKISFQGFITNSISIRNFNAGISAGIDFYRFRTIPIFLNVRMHVTKEKNVFAYTHLGYNIPFVTSTKDFSYDKNIHKFSGGMFAGFGGGVEFKLSKKAKLLLSAGYSLKNISYKIEYSSASDRYVFNLNRMVVNMGVEF